jgi:hypothetical protein
LLPGGSTDSIRLSLKDILQNRHRRGGCAKQPDCPISSEMADFQHSVEARRQ